MTIYEWFFIALVIATFGSLALLGGIFYWGRKKVKMREEEIVGDVPRVGFTSTEDFKEPTHRKRLSQDFKAKRFANKSYLEK